jgi:hypothetical protein
MINHFVYVCMPSVFTDHMKLSLARTNWPVITQGCFFRLLPGHTFTMYKIMCRASPQFQPYDLGMVTFFFLWR